MLQYNVFIFALYTSSSTKLLFFFGGGGGNLVSVMSFLNLVSILLRVYPMHSLLVYNTGVLLHEDVCFGIYMHSSGKQTT